MDNKPTEEKNNEGKSHSIFLNEIVKRKILDMYNISDNNNEEQSKEPNNDTITKPDEKNKS